MRMTRLCSRSFVLALAAAAVVSAGPLFADYEAWLDDFEDGALYDGAPDCGVTPCWTPSASPGVIDVVCGEVRIRNLGEQQVAGLAMRRTFSSDFSMRTQATQSGDSFRMANWLVFCTDASCGSGYYIRLVLESGSARMDLLRVVGGAFNTLDSASVADYVPGEEYLIQFDRVGQQLEARCWATTEDFPAEPLVAATDATYTFGQPGFGYSSYNAGLGEGVYRFFQFAGVMLGSEGGPEGYVETGPMCPVDYETWLDTFEDDALYDGAPDCGVTPCWTSSASPGVIDVVCGEVRIRNLGEQQVVGLAMRRTFSGDFSMRTQATQSGDSFRMANWLVFCTDASCGSGYYIRLMLENGSARMDLLRVVGGAFNTLDSAPVADYVPGEEYLIQFDRVGQQLEARCWATTEDFPAEPLVAATDATYTFGQPGFGYSSYNAGLGEGVYRFFQFAGVMLGSEGGPEGYAETGPMCPVLFKRGDANANNAIDIADAVFTLAYLFAKGKVPDCLGAADANDRGAVDIADAITTLSHLFAHSGDLPPPFGQCGIDPTMDQLGCLEYSHCEQ